MYWCTCLNYSLADSLQPDGWQPSASNQPSCRYAKFEVSKRLCMTLLCVWRQPMNRSPRSKPYFRREVMYDGRALLIQQCWSADRTKQNRTVDCGLESLVLEDFEVSVYGGEYNLSFGSSCLRKASGKALSKRRECISRRSGRILGHIGAH